jgi:hypothetical protein
MHNFVHNSVAFFNSINYHLGMNERPVYQRSLFPQWQLPVPTEGQVNEALRPHYPLLWSCIMDPWEDFLERRGTDRAFTDLTEDETAQWLTMQAAHQARALLANNDNFQLLTLHGKLVIVVQEKFALTIKKLTKRAFPIGGPAQLTRSNYLTTRNERLWNQVKDQELPDYPRIILGYQLLKEITEISIVIAYPRTRKRGVIWAYRMPDQSRVAPQVFMPISGTDEEPDKGFSITAPDATEREEEDKKTGQP